VDDSQDENRLIEESRKRAKAELGKKSDCSSCDSSETTEESAMKVCVGDVLEFKGKSYKVKTVVRDETFGVLSLICKDESVKNPGPVDRDKHVVKYFSNEDDWLEEEEELDI
jgi:hypothetical protein